MAMSGQRDEVRGTVKYGKIVVQIQELGFVRVTDGHCHEI